MHGKRKEVSKEVTLVRRFRAGKGEGARQRER